MGKIKPNCRFPGTIANAEVDGMNRTRAFNSQLPGHESVLTSRTFAGLPPLHSGKAIMMAWLVLNLRCMHKTYFYIITIMLPLAAVVAALISRLKVQVPVGYQDENGFHTGSGRTENKVNWPPFW